MSIYSDLNSISPTTQTLLYDVQDVYQALYNLFNTNVGERLFQPEFGFPLEDELFEFVDEITAVDIFRIVLDTINRWEKRVIVDTGHTTITPDPDNNTYTLVLYFQIVGLAGQTFKYQGSISN